MTSLSALVRSSRTPVAMPVATFPGTRLTGMTVRDLVTSARKQSETQLAFHRQFNTAVLMSCMDLSVEAEAFGASVAFSDTEVPTVHGRLVMDGGSIASLRVPEVGTARTAVYLDAVSLLAAQSHGAPVLAGMIGPFSLTGRLYGVTEAMMATASEPDVIEKLLEKVTDFLICYAAALKSSGASGIIVAEPSAGLLSPQGLASFSSPYVQRIIEAVEDDAFEIVLHNCAAKAFHLDAIAASGAHIVHFGAPMNIVTALRTFAPPTIVCGNLDPASVFVHSTPDVVAEQTRQLLSATAGFSNFVISSGCDIPAETSPASLEAFFREVGAVEVHG